MKKPSGEPDGQNRLRELVGKERTAQGLVATAAAAVFPFHLDEPVMAAKGLVEMGAIAGNRRGTELEVALVRVFVAAGIKLGVQIGISDGFFGFVSDHIGHAVRAAYARGWAVGAGGLGFATIGALVNVSDEGIFNIGTADCRVGVESAVSAAKTRALFYVRGSQNQIDSIGIQWEVMAGMGADNGCKVPIAKTRALGIVVENGTGEVQMTAHVASGIAIGRNNGFITGTAERRTTQEPFNQGSGY